MESLRRRRRHGAQAPRIRAASSFCSGAQRSRRGYLGGRPSADLLRPPPAGAVRSSSSRARSSSCISAFFGSIFLSCTCTSSDLSGDRFFGESVLVAACGSSNNLLHHFEIRLQGSHGLVIHPRTTTPISLSPLYSFCSQGNTERKLDRGRKGRRGMGSPSAAILFSCVAMFMVAVGSTAPNNSSFISMAALESADPASSRKLFGIPVMDQGLCPVRFERMRHFGRIEATCKGDQVPTSQCCDAFDAFACPYRDLLNDLENGCSTEMLIRINTICMLPTSFFVECGNSREGIDCESVKG